MTRGFLPLLVLVAAAPSDALPRVVDTALGEADSAVLGIDPSDWSGWSALLEDLDGDGFDDLVIGAPKAASAGNVLIDAGEVYIRYGSTALPKIDDFLATPPDVVIYGGPAGDHFGAALAAGYVNADGETDLVVGAPYGHGPALDRFQTGQAYVFFGGTRFPSPLDAVDADVILYGSAPSSRFGESLLVAELDGDGLPEIAVGAHGDASGGHRGGKVYVFSGRPLWPPALDVRAKDQSTTFFMDRANAVLGWALAGGDVDVDGVADLAMSELDASSSDPGPGAVHVFYSRIARGPQVDVGADPGDWVVRGAHTLGFFGHSLALGDFNGDGLLDIAAGAPDSSPSSGPDRAGMVYVIHGNAAAGRVVDLAVDPADRIILGRVRLGRLGTTLHSCDFDRDGIDDLLVGAPIETWDPAREYSGVARLVLGAPAAPPVMDLAMEEAEVTIVGRAGRGQLGRGLASGDMDGDCGTDLVVGAPLAPDQNDPRYAAGETYVVRGPAPPRSAAPCSSRACGSFDELDARIGTAEITSEGVRHSLHAKSQAARAAYERGHHRTAGNQLCALLHECDAQEGRHLSPATAERIRSCALALAQALGIPEPCTTGPGLLGPNRAPPPGSRGRAGGHRDQ